MMLRNLLFPYIRKSNSKSFSTSTLSEDELGKFQKLASQWWDVGGPFKGLHSLNLLRVPFVRNGITAHQKSVVVGNNAAAPLAGCQILDVGCGGGILSESLARLGASVTAIDPGAETITAASLHAAKKQLYNINYKISTVEQLKAEHSGPLFDAVTASEVIEHVDSPQFFIQNCSDLLKPGGSLFITTLNRTTISWLLGICAAENILNIVPRGTHDWNKFITPNEITSYLKKSDLQLRQIHGMAYNPLNNRWDWTRFTNINYALHATKIAKTEPAIVDESVQLNLEPIIPPTAPVISNTTT